MAKVSRSKEREIADQQIYDNNAKEITPEMVKLALDAIIDSNYNLVDDELEGMVYSGSQTLSEKFAEQGTGTKILLRTKSAVINTHTQGEGTIISGDVNADMQVDPNDGNHDNDLKILVTFPSVGTSNYIPVIHWEVTGSPWYERNNAIFSFGALTSTSMEIYIHSISTASIGKIWLTLLN